MALPTITVDDFKGWLKIVANQFKETDLEEYISQFTEEYLTEIVGEAALVQISTQNRQKWEELLNGSDYFDIEGKLRRFLGLRHSLIRFIYFEFVRDNFTSTQVGKVKGKSENSKRANDMEVLNITRSRYNSGVRIANTLFDFLEVNESYGADVTSFVDNLDGTYTLNINNTKYLETDELIKIEGVEYSILSAVEDTSIDINAGQVGIDFQDKIVSWEPFSSVEFCELEFAPL